MSANVPASMASSPLIAYSLTDSSVREQVCMFVSLGQNQLAQLSGLQLVEATVVQDVYGFLSLQEAPAVQQGSTGRWMVGMLREELLFGCGGLSAS
jgi:hypothetical protein